MIESCFRNFESVHRVCGHFEYRTVVEHFSGFETCTGQRGCTLGFYMHPMLYQIGTRKGGVELEK